MNGIFKRTEQIINQKQKNEKNNLVEETYKTNRFYIIFKRVQKKIQQKTQKQYKCLSFIMFNGVKWKKDRIHVKVAKPNVLLRCSFLLLCSISVEIGAFLM